MRIQLRRAGVAPKALTTMVAIGSLVVGLQDTANGGVPAEDTAPRPPKVASTDEGSLGAPLGDELAVPYHSGTTFDFDKGWRFALANPNGIEDPGGIFTGAEHPEYDDSRWRAIHIPHDWSIELSPTTDGSTTSSTAFYQGGFAWYRKSFTIPRSLAGKQLSVEFDGIYMDANIYFNGTWLTTHHYGYTGFSVNLPGARADGNSKNVLAVAVRNEIPSGRWYSGSGIYRNARLVATDTIHVQRWGSRVTTPDLDRTSAAGYAVARVETTLTGPPNAKAKTMVRSIVHDHDGTEVGRGTSYVLVTEAPVTNTIDIRVDNPQLWDTNSPYLYQVITEIVVGDQIVDRYVTRTGFRWTTFDPDAGFFLNGRSQKLHGVNLHHDLGALGGAVNADAMARQLATMKKMGVNAIRTSHNPPAPELVALCERFGIVLLVEAFDVWRTAKATFDYARFFETDSSSDITEMVLESRNSPAVVMWSIGNEIPESATEAGVPITRRLVDTVRALDPTRPIVIGSNNYGEPPKRGSAAEQILMMLDGVGLNYNPAGSVDALHAAYPRTFLFLSESSSATSTRGVYDQPEQLNTGENHTPGRRGASSYENNLETWTASGEYALKMDRDRPWLLGQFLWSGYDYLGEPTPYDVFPVKTSLFGAVDTAGFAKDRFYLFQSQWTSAPMVHVVPMDWTSHRPGDPVRVWAYSNLENVELFLNGRSLGTRRFDVKKTAFGEKYLETTEETKDDKTVVSGPHPGSYTGTEGTSGRLRLEWEVPFEPGTLLAVARRSGSTRGIVRDKIQTAGAPAKIQLSADHTTVSSDENALSFVTADVVDRAGTIVPDADTPLRFAVSGGRLVAVDNGRQESAESFRAPYRTAFNGKALALVAPNTGVRTVKVTVTGDRLATQSVTLKVGKVSDRQRLRGPGSPPVSWTTPDAPRSPVPPPEPGRDDITADASFSGAETTPPAAMIDGQFDSGGWSNAYVKQGTVLLPEISAGRRSDWVSLSWPASRPLNGAIAWFGVDEQHSLPATLIPEYWHDGRWLPIVGATVDMPSEFGQPVHISFPKADTTRIRLTMTSAHPGESNGFIKIVELTPRFNE